MILFFRLILFQLQDINVMILGPVLLNDSVYFWGGKEQNKWSQMVFMK